MEHDGSRAVVFGRSDSDGAFRIAFDAGFGEGWDATPSDLRRAVLMLTAHYFDNRQEFAPKAAATPFGVAALVQPWRPLRIGAGRGA